MQQSQRHFIPIVEFMRILFVLSCFIGFVMKSQVLALASECEPGYQLWKSKDVNNVGCIPHTMFSYLVCIDQISGGRLSVESFNSKNATKNLKVTVSGKGNGVIASGIAE